MIGQRSLLDRELTQIRDNVIQLGDMVSKAISKSMEALNGRNLTAAQEVILGDNEINDLRHKLEKECLRVLATQQPAATDLRTVVVSMHLAIELERMGDHASGIARLVERMDGDDEIDSLHKLPKMANRAQKMINKGLTAFINHDAELALSLIKEDEKIDKQYRKLFRHTLNEMRDENYIRRATFLLWVGHNLERIGDRAVNIAERIIFMVTGEFTEEPFAESNDEEEE